MFLFMVAGSVQHELCVTPRRLLSHTVSVAELELGQEGAAAPATTVSKTASSTFLFLLFFHVHSSRTHWHRGWTTQSVSLKKMLSQFLLFFLPTCGEKEPKNPPIQHDVRYLSLTRSFMLCFSFLWLPGLLS